ncbi:hypothetical protein DL96DRAFT_1818255 [Flagelloscypha sp. PMI_526]|nr:hypothetical protein DL96DRAFT_1818255 [Flagelloscypha sp. PMI_526]
MSLLGRFSALISVVTLFLVASGTPAPVDERASQNTIGDVLNFLKLGFVTGIHTTVTLDTPTTNLVSVNIDLKNDLPFELTLDKISSKAGVNGTVYAELDYTFPKPVVIHGSGTAQSGAIPNVRLTQGFEASLFLLDLGYLDLIDSDVSTRALTSGGLLGIPISIEGLKQDNVPADYTIGA